jgi:hypothetical protein
MIVKDGGTKLDDSKIFTLALIHHFFINEINLAEAICQSPNKASTKSLSSQ